MLGSNLVIKIAPWPSQHLQGFVQFGIKFILYSLTGRFSCYYTYGRWQQWLETAAGAPRKGPQKTSQTPDAGKSFDSSESAYNSPNYPLIIVTLLITGARFFCHQCKLRYIYFNIHVQKHLRNRFHCLIKVVSYTGNSVCTRESELQVMPNRDVPCG